MSQDLSAAPPTLATLFPECKTLEEKAFEFLSVYQQSGSSYRGTATRLEKRHPDRAEGRCNHATVKSIVEFLKKTPQYKKFQDKIDQELNVFYSRKSLSTLFGGFDDELKRVEKIIKSLEEKEKEKKELTKNDKDFLLSCMKHKKALLDSIGKIGLGQLGKLPIDPLEDNSETDSEADSQRKKALQEIENTNVQ